MVEYLKKNAKWLFPILLMAVITPFTPYLDLEISRHFYHYGTPSEPFSQNQLLLLIYVYGLVPGQIVIILATIGLLFSYISSTRKHWRPYTLFIVLTLAIGSGLITHALLKDNWGRPRPKQVIEFGGKQEFRPYYKPNFFNKAEPSKSFPCGHCTMGFYFFTFIILGYRFQKKWLFYTGITLTAILSTLLGYARIAQGGHFFSDVLMAGLIMWLTALFLEWLIFEEYP